jgi:hypothetical protein
MAILVQFHVPHNNIAAVCAAKNRDKPSLTPAVEGRVPGVGQVSNII